MLLKEWRRYLLRENNEGITYETGSLARLLYKYPSIKRLALPGYSLQQWYKMVEFIDIASVALDGGKPVGIMVIKNSDDLNHYDKRVAILSLFVPLSHRGLGIASRLFDEGMAHSEHWRYVAGSMMTNKMLVRRKYKQSHKIKTDYPGAQVFLNPFYKPKR